MWLGSRRASASGSGPVEMEMKMEVERHAVRSARAASREEIQRAIDGVKRTKAGQVDEKRMAQGRCTRPLVWRQEGGVGGVAL